MKNAKCPYCKKKVSYLAAFSEKNNGEHTCRKCGKNSTIYFIRNYKIAIALAIIAAVIIMFICISPENVNNLWGFLFVIIPFAVLYLITPLFYRLVPLKKKKKKADNLDMYNTNSENYTGATRIINKVGTNEIEQDFTTQQTRIMPKVTDEEFTDISNIVN